MRNAHWPWLVAAGVWWLALPAAAQQTNRAPAAPTASPAAPAANAVAATVNGQAILEAAVQRGLKRVPPTKQAEARAELVNFLIDNALIDQYLTQQQITADPKEVDARMQQVRDAIQKQGATFDKVMQELNLTEAELRSQVNAQLRWDKFVNQQSTDKVLRDIFNGNRDMFDGTMVRARHILLTPPSGNAQAVEQAKVRLAGFKKQIEDAVVQGLAKLPPNTDNLAREQARAKLTEDAFCALARKESACPSKAQDGDLGYFPRAGSMVEPFAKAAFALKPYEISDVVATQFGFHLILAVDRKPGKEPNFDDPKTKEEIKEVYGDRLREAIIAKLRPTSRIVINPAK